MAHPMDAPHITSASNPRVKLARKLQRRRRRQETGLCVLEGRRLVEDAWRAGAAFDVVFVRDDQPSGDLPWLADLQAAGVPIFLVTEAVMAALSETVTPQGLVALVRTPQLPLPTPLRFALVLDRVRDPGNAGALLRSAAAAGVDLVLFGPETVDPFGGKVLRSAMGAHFRIPVRACRAWSEVDEWLGAGMHVYVADVRGRLTYDAVDWTRPAALIVGGEAHGPSPAARSRASSIVIPMAHGVESLNVAVAGSVILFEAARQQRLSSGHSLGISSGTG